MSRSVKCAKLGDTLPGLPFKPSTHVTLKEQCEAFLFGDGGQLPPDFVPEA